MVVIQEQGRKQAQTTREPGARAKGVQNIVRETSLLPFHEMRAGILNRVAAWREGQLTDDMSLVLVEV